ncbi:MAG: hypothetical protein A2984_03345 [Omnitrophica WOR_2 bacterium RIFCSPLOWO2_01_FULL_41_12]|nr:MAG: hypothetical protein A2984_03345 [Omnitrophica WOR_2 bacterium RIFCSPLOWO2_01_FULL_41_12]
MKQARIVLWMVVFGLLILVNTGLAADKFGYVDLSRIFSEYQKTKDYDKNLQEKTSAYEGEREKKANEVKQLQDKINLLSDKEKEGKKPELEKKIKAFQEYDRQQQTDLRKEQDEKMKEILKDIDDSVKKYAQAQSYTLVFNDRVLVYQDKSLDISDKIIVDLNKGYKK